MGQAFKKKLPNLASYALWPLGIITIVLPWFISPGYLFFTDFVWGPSAHIAWSSNTLPFSLVIHGLSKLLPYDLAEKCALTALLAFVLWSGYRLAASVTEDKALASVLALFLLFNPFVYDRLGYGQIGIIGALACLALGTAALITAYRNGEVRWELPLVGLWFGLAIEMSPHFVFFSAILGAAWLPAFLVRWGGATRRGKISRMRILAGPSALAVGVVLLVNAHWAILPRLIGSAVAGATQIAALGPNDFEAFRTSGRSGLEAWRNVLMFSGFWGKDQLRYFDLTRASHNWGRSYLLLLALAVYGLRSAWCDKEKRPLATALLLAFGISAFLAVGMSSGMTRPVTLWLMGHLPLYVGLRETQKWVAVVVVAFGIMLAWGAARLFELPIVKRNRSVSLSALAFVCVMQAPTMLWGLGGAVRPTEYPEEWAQAKEVLNASGCRGNVLFFPRHMYMGFSWIGQVVVNPARAYFDCPVMTGSDPEWLGSTDPYVQKNADITSFIAGEGTGASAMFAAHDVSHLMLVKEGDWDKYSWVDTLPELRPIYEGETISIYETIR